jgi:hypothetical protein
VSWVADPVRFVAQLRFVHIADRDIFVENPFSDHFLALLF